MIEKAFKNQLINAVENIYIQALEEYFIGYKNRTIYEIIDYLKYS